MVRNIGRIQGRYKAGTRQVRCGRSAGCTAGPFHVGQTRGRQRTWRPREHSVSEGVALVHISVVIDSGGVEAGARMWVDP